MSSVVIVSVPFDTNLKHKQSCAHSVGRNKNLQGCIRREELKLSISFSPKKNIYGSSTEMLPPSITMTKIKQIAGHSFSCSMTTNCTVISFGERGQSIALTCKK
jgi:hypothetical protein